MTQYSQYLFSITTSSNFVGLFFIIFVFFFFLSTHFIKIFNECIKKYNPFVIIKAIKICVAVRWTLWTINYKKFFQRKFEARSKSFNFFSKFTLWKRSICVKYWRYVISIYGYIEKNYKWAEKPEIDEKVVSTNFDYINWKRWMSIE